MDSEPRKCGAILGPGQTCAEFAAINATRHIYQKREAEAGAVEHVLMESHYDLACPKCGNRTEIYKHPAD